MEDISQLPNLQPIQPIPIIKDKNIFKYLFIVSIFVILAIIIVFYFVLNNKINQLDDKQTAEITSIPTQTITGNIIIPTVVTTIAPTESTLVEKDANNNLYTNNKFGFSLVIPKTIKQVYCQKTADTYSFTDENGEETPLSFFENKDTIYLAGKYFYTLTGEQKIIQSNGGYISKYSSCPKNITTFDNVQIDISNNPTPSSLARMLIYASNIKNDNELEQFIKSKYGSGCKLGEKTQSTTVGIFDVNILGDGKDLGETQCPINFAIKTKFNSIKEKVVIFELGQDCPLYNDFKKSCYDTDIIDSLKFN